MKKIITLLFFCIGLTVLTAQDLRIEFYNPDDDIEADSLTPISYWLIDQYNDILYISSRIFNDSPDTIRENIFYEIFLRQDSDSNPYLVHSGIIDISAMDPPFIVPGEYVNVIFPEQWVDEVPFDQIYDLGYTLPFYTCIQASLAESSNPMTSESCIRVTDEEECHGERTIHYSINVCNNEPYDFFGQSISHQGTYFHTDTVGDCITHHVLDVIFEFPAPHIVLSGNEPFCEGQSVNISARDSYTVVNDTHFEWSNGQTGSEITVSYGGAWHVTATNVATGCSSTLTFHVEEKSKPLIELSGEFTHCDGTPIQITASGDYTTIFWSTGVVGDTLVSAQSGNYSVTAVGENGCLATNFFDLAIGFPSESEFDRMEDSYYIWNGFVYTESGDYVQVLTNSTGCDSTVTLHLSIAHPNTADVVFDTTCAGQSYQGFFFANEGDTVLQIAESQLIQLHIGERYVAPHIIASGIMDPCAPDPVTLSLDLPASECRWRNGEVGDTLVVTQPDLYYAFVTNEHGCTARTEELVVGESQIISYHPEICMVTCAHDNSNVIQWDVAHIDYPHTVGIKVYRIDNEGEYILLEERSSFEVLDFPLLDERPVAYRMMLYDNCGGQSWSPVTKPVWLTATQTDNGLLLKWNPYEGTNVSHYVICKSDTQYEADEWVTVGPDITQYVDESSPESVWKYYFVKAIIDHDCSFEDHFSEDISLTHTAPQSNMVRVAPASVTQYETVLDATIYPNPTDGQLHLELENLPFGETVCCQIFNLAGKKVMQLPISNPKSMIDLSHLTSGMYILHLTSSSSLLSTKKVVISR